MRGLATLLRLASNRTEELRVTLADAIRARESAAAALEGHAAAAAAETHRLGVLLAAPGLEVEAGQLRDWSAWRRRAGQEAAAMQRDIADRAAREDACRDAMRESVADGKRLELAIAARARAERLRAARKREAAAEEQALRRGAAEA